MDMSDFEDMNETISKLVAELQLIREDSYAQAFALDTIWLLTTAIGIVFMQTGFAMLEAGAVRAKNAKAILMKNISDATVGALIWYVVGYGLFKGSGRWFGGDDPLDPTSSLFLISSDKSNYMSDFFQQYGFAVTTATIVSGGVASRMLFAPYIIISLIMVGFIYPVISHWAWSEAGWLNADFGFLDFAGSGVVHLTGGIGALIGSIMVGPRYGKFVRYEDNSEADLFDEDEEQGFKGKLVVREIPGHSATLYVLGTMILFVGWFSFNAGSSGGLSTLAQSNSASLAAANTLFAASSGSIGAWLIGIGYHKKIHLPNACNGLLAGLVAITGPCAYVEPWAAILIGVFASFTVMFTTHIMTNVVHIDDPLDAFAIHGMCGALGVITTGLFAIDGGLFTSGTVDQIIAQFIGLAVISAWSGVTCLFFFLLLRHTIGITVDEDDQILGLDLLYGSGFAYPEFDTTSVMEFNRHKQIKRSRLKDDHDRLSFTNSESGGMGSEGLPSFFFRKSKRTARSGSEAGGSEGRGSESYGIEGSERALKEESSFVIHHPRASGL